MSDQVDRFAHGIAENIIHALTSDSDDGFYEACHIDSEEQSKQNLQTDNEETMDGFPSSNRNYGGGNVSNAEDRLARNEDSTVINLSNEKLGNSSKNNTEGRYSDKFVPDPNPCHSATDNLLKSEQETQKMTTDIPDDLFSQFETMLRSRADSKASSEDSSKLEDSYDKDIKIEDSNVLNCSVTEDEFKYTESVNDSGNLDVIYTRVVKPEAQSPNSVNIVDTSSLEAGENEVPWIENKFLQKPFDAGHEGASIDNVVRDVVPMSETKSFQKGFEVGKSRIEKQTEALTDSDSSQKDGIIDDSMANTNRTEITTEMINQILKKLNIGNPEEKSIPNSASSEELSHNRSSQNHELKLRRAGVSEMRCSFIELDTSDFDERNSIAFGLPKTNSEIGHRRSKDDSKEQSSAGRRLVNVPNKDGDAPDFVGQPSTSSIKRRNDTQSDEPKTKFRKRCQSSVDAETGEETESRHRFRSASAGNPKCNTNEGMKGKNANVQSGDHTNVKDCESLDLLQKRKREPDEGSRTIVGEPLSTSKKLKKQVDSDLMLEEREFSKEDSS